VKVRAIGCTLTIVDDAHAVMFGATRSIDERRQTTRARRRVWATEAISTGDHRTGMMAATQRVDPNDRATHAASDQSRSKGSPGAVPNPDARVYMAIARKLRPAAQDIAILVPRAWLETAEARKARSAWRRGCGQARRDDLRSDARQGFANDHFTLPSGWQQHTCPVPSAQRHSILLVDLDPCRFLAQVAMFQPRETMRKIE